MRRTPATPRCLVVAIVAEAVMTTFNIIRFDICHLPLRSAKAWWTHHLHAMSDPVATDHETAHLTQAGHRTAAAPRWVTPAGAGPHAHRPLPISSAVDAIADGFAVNCAEHHDKLSVRRDEPSSRDRCTR